MSIRVYLANVVYVHIILILLCDYIVCIIHPCFVIKLFDKYKLLTCFTINQNDLFITCLAIAIPKYIDWWNLGYLEWKSPTHPDTINTRLLLIQHVDEHAPEYAVG